MQLIIIRFRITINNLKTSIMEFLNSSHVSLVSLINNNLFLGFFNIDICRRVINLFTNILQIFHINFTVHKLIIGFLGQTGDFDLLDNFLNEINISPSQRFLSTLKSFHIWMCSKNLALNPFDCQPIQQLFCGFV